MKIRELSFTNCLSFGPKGLSEQDRLELADFNVFVGRNDVGKSNVLMLFHLIDAILDPRCTRPAFSHARLTAPIAPKEATDSLHDSWWFLRDRSSDIEFCFSLEIEGSEEGLVKETYNASRNRAASPLCTLLGDPAEYPKVIRISGYLQSGQRDNPQVTFTRIDIPTENPAFRNRPTLFHWDRQNNTGIVLTADRRSPGQDSATQCSPRECVTRDTWEYTYLQSIRDDITRLLGKLYQGAFTKLIVPINPLRKVNREDMEYLRQLKNASEEERPLYDILRDLIRDPGGDPQASELELLVTSAGSGEHPLHIITKQADRQVALPLTRYGSGVEHVMAMAIRILRSGPGKIVLLEQPEAHFHAKLQRKFLRFLKDSQSWLRNQYLITGYSDVLISETLDIEGGEVFQVHVQEAEESTPRYSWMKPLHHGKTLEACADLGIRPWDIFEPNGIIWVKGPSDEIYLQKWIHLYCEKHDLTPPREGRDYRVFWYGGSILEYCTVDLPQEIWTDERIGAMSNVLSINKNALVVIDRGDGESAATIAQSTTEQNISRMQALCNSLGVLCWITVERSIEHYLPQNTQVWRQGELTKAYLKNKAAGAVKVIGQLDIEALDMMDLEERIGEVVARIRGWNT